MKRWDLSRFLGAAFVFVFVLVVYVRTMAVSVSFWDCGEFIACAHILGVPHPPGAPLHGLLGRLFSLLPLFGTVARRVNFLSVLTGALAAGVLYFVVERVSGVWFGDGLGWRGRVLGVVGGVVAGLLMAFSDTYWSNAVEAEVYAPAMFLMVLSTWLVLKWQEVRERRGGDHLLLLVIYLLFLGIGVHQTAFLVAPGVFLLVVLTDVQWLRDWRFWLVWVVFGVVVVTIADQFMMLLGLALVVTCVGMMVSGQGRGGRDLLWWFVVFELPVVYLFWVRWVEFSWLMFLVVQGWLLVLWVLEARLGGGEGSRSRWRFCFWLVLFAVVGYSIQAFIPVRSLLDPVIDENNPDSWARFMMYLKRLQYGQQSMLASMFHRKGSLVSQFGVHERMGFWGFFRQGWAPVGWWPLVLGIGLFGMVVGWFRERRRWLFLMVLMVVCSFVIVMWMNFSDGTRGVQLEVRDRDYFFTPTYVFFSLWMGLGASGLLWLVLRKLRGWWRELLFWVLVVLLVISPVGSLSYNYHRHDRSRNWIAHDYAYNLLNSCDQDGILFTNGDNDTFPLWYIQEVESIRRDVRVVNLSLLNTGWYIKQLKYMEPRVPIDLTDEQIERLMALRLRDGTILRVQDQAIDEIIGANRWQRPIFFAVTVPENNRRGLDEHLQMEAMVYRLLPETRESTINIPKTRHSLWEVYRYRSMADSTIYRAENANRLLFNLSSAFISLATEYLRLGQNQEAETQLRKATEVISGDWRSCTYLAEVLVRAQDYDGAQEQLLKALRYNPEFFVLHRMLGSTYVLKGEPEKGLVEYQKAYQLNPKSRPVVMDLIELYRALNMLSKGRSLLADWVSRNPNDSDAARQLRQWSAEETGR